MNSRSRLNALWQKLLALTLAMALAVSAAFSLLGHALDWFIYDRAIALWPDTGWQSDSVHEAVVVAIDEESLARIGRWPWPRQRHAELIQRLGEVGSAAIAYNVAFIEPDRSNPYGDRTLMQAVADNPQMISPVFADPAGKEIVPFYATELPGQRYGHVFINVDDDAITRRVFLYAGVGQPRWPIMGLAARQAVNGGLQSVPGRRSPFTAIDFETLWSQDFEVLIPFRTGNRDFPRYSFADVLDGVVPASAFKGKAVFVGVLATGFEQKFLAYVDDRHRMLSGTEIQAYIYKALQLDQAITVLPSFWSLLLAALVIAVIFPLLWLSGFKVSAQRNGVLLVSVLLFAAPVVALSFSVWVNLTPAIAAFAALLICWAVQQVKRLDTSARRDPLTALANRRMFDETCAEEWDIAKKRKTPIALLMVDVDYFKQFNDHFGHTHGDWALVRIANILPKYSRRARDLAARYGGEEFSIVLPETDRAQAEGLAEELCREVESLNINHPGSKEFGVVTLSIGVASTIPDADDSLEELIHKADEALYRAKADGRNCVRVACDDSEAQLSLT